MKSQHISRLFKILPMIVIIIITWHSQQISQNHRNTVTLIKSYQKLLLQYDPTLPPEQKINYSPEALASLKQAIEMGENRQRYSYNGVKSNIDDPLIWIGIGFILIVLRGIFERKALSRCLE